MASRRRVLRLVEFACAGVLLLVSGCGTFMFSNQSLEEGTLLYTTPLHYGPLTRTYLMHVPRNYDGVEARPLVLVLHGAFSTAGEMERRSGFSPLADREGFFVAYPNGIGLFGFLQHWNAGHCCGLAKMDNVDDVGFLCCVIGDVSRRFRIDASRIYVVGHSNGGMLAYEFARARCRNTAAIAVVAGTLGSAPNAQERPEMVGPPQYPVPLLAIHGWDDQTVPVEGGTRSFNGPRYASVFDSVGAWRATVPANRRRALTSTHRLSNAPSPGATTRERPSLFFAFSTTGRTNGPERSSPEASRPRIPFGGSMVRRSSGISSASTDEPRNSDGPRGRRSFLPHVVEVEELPGVIPRMRVEGVDELPQVGRVGGVRPSEAGRNANDGGQFDAIG